MTISGPHRGLAETLDGIVGAAHLLIDGAVVAPYVTDWTQRFTGPCLVGVS